VKDAEVAVEVNGVSRAYGNFLAVKDATFEVLKGSCFGLVGPNGAGKTTLIKILTGLIKPTKGEIRVMEYPAGSIGAKKYIGYLPENFSFNEKWLVMDMMIYIGILYGLPKEEAENRALGLLEWTGLREWSYFRFGELSAGMKQRVGMAQALISDPDILILDEPAASLDPLGRLEVLRKVRELVDEQNKTVLISSHILTELERVLDSVAVMDKGFVVASGKIEDIMEVESFYILEVDKPNFLVEKIKRYDGVTDVSRSRKEIRVKTRDPAEFEKRVLKEILESNIRLFHFWVKGETLEEIFMRLVGKKKKREE
jgi:ABC-2 type transport system ATP-binding protein